MYRCLYMYFKVYRFPKRLFEFQIIMNLCFLDRKGKRKGSVVYEDNHMILKVEKEKYIIRTVKAISDRYCTKTRKGKVE